MKGIVSKLFIGLGALGLSIGLQAATPDCSDIYWENEPVLENKLFKGALIINCEIKKEFSSSIKKIQDYYMDYIINNPELVEMILAPTNETTGQLPGMIYKSKLLKKTDSGNMEVWLTGHIATDLETGLIYTTESDKIKGEKNAKYTRKIISMSRIEKTKVGFMVTLRSENHIKQPWIAPDGIFVRKVKEAMMEGATKAFNEEIEAILEAI